MKTSVRHRNVYKCAICAIFWFKLSFSYWTFLIKLSFLSDFLNLLREIVWTSPKAGLPGGATGKESTFQCRRSKRQGFDPRLGQSSRGGNGNPLQYSCLENSMDRGDWRAIQSIGLQRVGHNRANEHTLRETFWTPPK